MNLSSERYKPKDIGSMPVHIAARSDLTTKQKLLYLKIKDLSYRYGYCCAGSKWLGEQLDIGKEAVTFLINDMERKNLIGIKYIDNQRRIYMVSENAHKYNQAQSCWRPEEDDDDDDDE